MTRSLSYRCPACSHTVRDLRPAPGCPACGGPWLDAVYDLPRTAAVWRAELPARDRTMWRYRELLPLRDERNVVTLGEGGTPLLKADALGAMLGLRGIHVKDERQGPTGSFKDRHGSLAVSAMKEAGVGEAVVASTGNVAISYSAYCARAGIRLWAFLDGAVPPEKVREVALYGTEVRKVPGTYDAAKQAAARFAGRRRLFLDRGMTSVTAREAMKTLAFEIAEQLGRRRGNTWAAPDWYVQAVSGGMGPLGVWQGFKDLFDMGFTSAIPRIAVVQAEGCAPMVDSFHRGLETSTIVTSPATAINALATGDPGPAYARLRALVLRHGGAFVKVDDESAFAALRVVARSEGLSLEPAAAAAFAGLFKMARDGVIGPDDTVVVNASGHTIPVGKMSPAAKARTAARAARP